MRIIRGKSVSNINPKNKVTVNVKVMHGDADGYSTHVVIEFKTDSQKGVQFAELKHEWCELRLKDIISDLQKMLEWNETQWNNRPKLYPTLPTFDQWFDQEWPMDAHWEGEYCMLQKWWVRYFDEQGHEYELDITE